MAITVAVPIFNAADALERCLGALLEHTHETDVLLVDDASTDPRIDQLLDRFAPLDSRWEVLRNAENLGFVATANRIFRRTPDTNIVLLNSDALVTDGWLERIDVCAKSDARIATISPFSNNAEICSFPRFCAQNPIPENIDKLALRFRTTGRPRYPDLPTTVGFCMFIRRAALNQLGGFDPAFGRGYGEENDFCMRAAKAGWRNVLCDDAYVAHLGGRSFDGIGMGPGPEAMALVLERHPDYEREVHDFIARDPLAERRSELEVAVADLL